MNNTLPLSKILTGISKALSIAGKVIPIYQDTKPLFNNVKNIYSMFKNNNEDKVEEKIIKQSPIKKETKTLPKIDNSPQFFI